MANNQQNDPASTAGSFPVLSGVDVPDDIRELDAGQLPALADDVRRFLIETISQSGGHLGAGLGTVELTVALHYVFNTPDDRLVWDIGHQAYPHKILTGRKDQLHTIRQPGGISGFLRRDESEYDTFGAGHSSTSISAAVGMAVAAQRLGLERQVVAIIGDGALTGGMAYEALNNAGNTDLDLLVVLNDNDMSISPNVGAMTNYLARLLSGQAYSSVRGGSKTVLSTVQPVHDLARRWEEHMKGMFMPSTFFEELGFNYIGPVDGHNIPALVATLRNMKKMRGPRFLHIVTSKGKGYEPAEGDPLRFHAVTPFDPKAGKIEKAPSGKTYTSVFSDWLCDMASRDVRLIGVTPAMREGSGLVEFSKRFPERYFDVGIAEQHALTFAAGIACEGLKPVVAIYSTFLQRAYDQLIHDISVQDLDVMLAIDRAGLVGADGATHAGAFDHSFLRCIPGMVIMAPADEAECRDMLYTGFIHEGPTAVRYPRGSGPGIQTRDEMQMLPIGKAQVRREGKSVALLAFGSMVAPAEEVGDAIDATVVNMRFIKPLDSELIEAVARSHDLLVTIEENTISGGAGAGICEHLNNAGLTVPMLHLGLPDEHLEHGKPGKMLAEAGLDAAGIRRAVLDALPNRISTVTDNTVA